MNKEIKAQNPSTLFFSNIRAVVVLLVILLHVALAFAPAAANWWYVVNSRKTILADIIAGSLDIMLMSILFFIAGYFTLPSYQKCPDYRFLLKKARNLMVPWLIGMLLLNPFLVNVIHSKMGNGGNNFKKTLSYYQNFIQWPEKVLQNRVDSPLFFSQYHFWFLSLLFFFFCGFYLMQKLFGKTEIRIERATSKRTVLTAFLSLTLISSLGYFLIFEFIKDQWFVVSLLQIQLSRLLPYICFFYFGIWSYKRNWINRISLMKRPFLHLISLIGSILVYLALYDRMRDVQDYGIQYMYSLFRYAICSWSLLISLRIGQKYFNRKTTINHLIAQNSFGVYVIHLNVSIFVTMMFVKINGIVPELKILIIFFLSTAISYGLIMGLKEIHSYSFKGRKIKNT